MFREGHYLEVIKAEAEYCAATAVITVKEKTVEIRKKKVSTNKWLSLEDWAALYEILEKALIQNSQKFNPSEKKKSTRHLDIAYTFEASEDPNDRTSLPTIRVRVSPIKKKSKTKSTSGKKENSDNSLNSIRDTPLTSNTPKIEAYDPTEMQEYRPSKIQDSNDDPLRLDMEVEEYIPDVLSTKKTDVNRNANASNVEFKYIPSRKSALQKMILSTESNEYVPAIVTENTSDALYIPNSIPNAENIYDTYEPTSSSNTQLIDEYIPNSNSTKKKIEEYQPDFTCKMMTFDNSYVPSSSKMIKELKKSGKKPLAPKKTRKDTEKKYKDSAKQSKKSSPLSSSTIKREM